jgi:DNA-binding CsgD family transcriptional regulator
VLSCLRSRGNGPFAEEQTRILQLLMPHMQRALQLHAQPQCQPDPQPERRTGCDPERSHGGSLRRHQSRQWPESAAAAVFVSDPESQPEPAATILRRLFNLTGAEARLAAAPMEGKSLEATAVEFRVSRDTVRAQLRSDSARQEPAVRGS